MSDFFRVAKRLAGLLVFSTPLLMAEPSAAPAPPARMLPLQAGDPSAWTRTAYLRPSSADLEKTDWTTLLKDLASRRTGRPLADPSADGKMPSVPLPLKIQVAHARGATREIITWSNGKETEKWIDKGIGLQEDVRDGSIFVNDPRFGGNETNPFAVSPYTELFWLRPGFYQGIRRIGERDYYFYMVEASTRQANEPVTESMAAWIDAQTLLPFASMDDDSFWLYRPEEDRPAKLELPAAFQAALEKNEARYHRVIGRFKAVKP